MHATATDISALASSRSRGTGHYHLSFFSTADLGFSWFRTRFFDNLPSLTCGGTAAFLLYLRFLQTHAAPADSYD